MNWMCKECRAINSGAETETKPLATRTGNIVTCRKCGAKNDYDAAKIESTKIPAEFYALTIDYGRVVGTSAEAMGRAPQTVSRTTRHEERDASRETAAVCGID